MRPVGIPRTARHGVPDRTMPQGRKRQMGRPNVHKASRQSQLSETDTGTLKQNGSNRTRPVGRPHTARHHTLDRTMPQGRKRQMGHSNVHKALVWSQLIKTDDVMGIHITYDDVC